MTAFTPWQSLAGGALIGLAAVLLMATSGRIAGMTGIIGGLLPPWQGRDWAWRLAFLSGAVVAPLIYVAVYRELPALDVPASPSAMIIGGILVGIGVTLGSGCTSGHGVCGLARRSPRSLAATVVFMATTAVTVFVLRHGFVG